MCVLLGMRRAAAGCVQAGGGCAECFRCGGGRKRLWSTHNAGVRKISGVVVLGARGAAGGRRLCTHRWRLCGLIAVGG